LAAGSYWQQQIKCQDACPVNTDARGYIRAIADGDDERAYLIARGPNPLASICGRVCGAPCESACRRGDVDQPIAIRALKRYVCDQFGPDSEGHESHDLIERLKAAALRHQSRECEGQNELLPLLQSISGGKIDRDCVAGKSIGIIGSGPAGLAAAHDLALFGFKVTIYEMESVLAGMLMLGIPEYRLPRDLIQAEVEVIKALGVEAKTNCCVGKDVQFSELRERHDAVIVAVGCKKSRKLTIAGGDAKGVLGGVEFLREVALNIDVEVGSRIVVIGGGNVAYDVGRTVLRQIGIDAARTARRSKGVGEVHLCSLESLDEMPADDIEIIEGDEEGVVRHNSLGPKEILVDDEGKVRGVLFQKCLQVFDENRRFSPKFDENDTLEIPCDTVLLSVGQTVDIGFIDSEKDGIELTERGYIQCDQETGRSSAKGVYVSGDLAYGPKLLIHAVASGKAVARAIYEDLSGKKLERKSTELHLALPNYGRESGYENTKRVELSTLDPEQRILSQSSVVENGLTEEEARCEAGRCFDCGVNTIFDGDKCVLCGGCAEVCPENCLQLVHIDSWGQEVDQTVETQLDGFPKELASAIVKDETRCIRCSLCAERCPTGAITMERYLFREDWTCLDV
ncbi:MAG: FAD-dependent oxidoreductase, partial [Planctomycetota bacterium]|nr:FAD-dependent oxidoreductase [Planctomycetota bacterium]